jgi:hypothetical protein
MTFKEKVKAFVLSQTTQAMQEESIESVKSDLAVIRQSLSVAEEKLKRLEDAP